MRNPADYGARALTLALGTAVVLSLGLAFDSALGLKWLGNDQGYAPGQPIAYSHRLHAGELAIPCLYCHSGAERSKTAGIPPLGTCMNCHSKATSSFLVARAEAAEAQKEKRKPRVIVSGEIQKIYDALALDSDGKPVPGKRPVPVKWNRVHNLADFVYFDHRPHVTAGLACQTCHGPVETMELLRQEAPLTMGWCVECHRTSKVQAPLLNWPKTAAPKGQHPSTDCKACHY